MFVFGVWGGAPAKIAKIRIFRRSWEPIHIGIDSGTDSGPRKCILLIFEDKASDIAYNMLKPLIFRVFGAKMHENEQV